MKNNLKYIQLFEAFDSKVLGKTLGYIKDSNDREKFFNQIKKMCSSIDYPLSKLSDDYFEYLPFKKALKVAAMTGDEPCEATSAREFPQYAVEGAKCEGGKIKRKWGARTRDVVCPVCNGTGVKPKRSELKLLKFWFTAEGKYVATTMVDGIIRGVQKLPLSHRMSDYTIGDRVTNLSSLNGGETVKLTISGSQMIAYIIKDGNRYYAIQNNASGSAPGHIRSSVWQRFGRYSWSLGGGEYRDMYLAMPKNKAKKEEVELEADPLTWNVACNFNYSGVQASSTNVEELIKDAHFAIVFDYGKLKKSEFETKSDIESSREMAKKGSRLDPSQSDEEIRKRNIERYINTISQNLDITKDISNCNKLITRSLGGKRGAIFVVYTTDIYSRFTYTINDYLRLMRAETDSNKESIAEEISDRAEELFRVGMKRSNKSNDILKEIRNRLKSENKDEKYFKILDLLSEISEAIYDNLNNYQVDSIEDFEVVAQKVSSMGNVLNSDRYGASRFFGYVVDNIASERPNRAYDNLVDDYYINPDSLISSLQRIKTLMSKL